MKQWLDLSITERMQINKEQGFTVDSIFPKDTEVRKRFDEMVKETTQHLSNVRTMKNLGCKKTIMDLSPEEILEASDNISKGNR